MLDTLLQCGQADELASGYPVFWSHAQGNGVLCWSHRPVTARGGYGGQRGNCCVSARYPHRLLAGLDIKPAQFALGTVAEGRTASATVTLTNRGERPLHIASIGTGCGCTTARSPKVLAPGTSSPLTVFFDSTNQRGAVQKSVTIVFAEVPGEPRQLAIEGTIYEAIRITPRETVLPDLNGGEHRRFTFDAVRIDGKPLTLTPKALPSPVTASFTNPAPNAVRVSCDVTAPLLPGNYTETLSFATNNAALPEIEARVSYTVRPRFIVEPNAANFGAVAPNAKPKMFVTIRGTARVRLQAVPPGVLAKLVMPKSAGSDYTLAVSLTGQGKDSALSERLTLATDDPKQPRIIVPVYAVFKR